MQEYLKQPMIRTFIMVLFGVGLAASFHSTCKGDRCVVVRAPDPDVVEKQVFRYNDGCYRFQAKMVSC